MYEYKTQGVCSQKINFDIVEKDGSVDAYRDAAGTDPVTKTPTSTNERDDLALFSDEQMIAERLDFLRKTAVL